jgi:hypothetical protein
MFTVTGSQIARLVPPRLLALAAAVATLVTLGGAS